jgi:tetratricopeptide (TPR) repeat protein
MHNSYYKKIAETRFQDSMTQEKEQATWAATTLGDRTAKHLAKDGFSHYPLIFLGLLVCVSLISLFFLSPDPAAQCSPNVAYLNCERPVAQQPQEISYRDRGRAYLRMGETERAINDFDEALRRDPRDSETLLNRAKAFRTLGQIYKAEADYEAVIKLGDRVADAYFGRGVMYVESGAYSHALIEFTRAIDLAPHEIVNYLWRGYAELEMGAANSALTDFDKALELDPGDADALRLRSRALYELDRFAEAIENADRAIAHAASQSRKAELWRRRGLARLKLPSRDDAALKAALADLQKASAGDAQSAAWQATLCYDLAIFGLAEQAGAYCDLAMQLDPEGAETRGTRAYVHVALKRWPEARADLDYAIAKAPDMADFRFLRGYVLEQMGDPEAARQDYAASRRIDPDIEKAMHKIGIVPAGQK